MQPPHQRSRINLDELKAQIVKKLGPEGSKQYFYYLQRFLSLKLSKVEFNKLCLRVLGRVNIPLHNQLFRSMLRNACCAKGPPSTSHQDDVSKPFTHIGGQEIPSDGYQQNGSHISMTQASGSPGLSNGDDRPTVSPRKAISAATQAILENGYLNPSASGRPVQQAEDESENVVSEPTKMPVVRRSPDCPALVHSKDQTDLVVRNDGQRASSMSPLRAPLGLPLCPVSIGGACRNPPLVSSTMLIGTFDDGALLDSNALRDRMEHISLAQGLEGVSVECANVLNHGLDSYMKGLIRSCIELVGARARHELTKNNAPKIHHPMKLINVVKPDHQYSMPSSGAHQYQMQINGTHQYQMPEQKLISPISLQDFRAAMELNPQQLGEDFPLLLEKIYARAFEE